MANMIIDNYDITSDAFTFPVNPTSFDDQIDNNYKEYPIAFQRHHILAGMGGINPKTLILSGYFYGTDKMTNYRTLAKHFTETYKLKKLYFESDKFYLGVGKNIKQTQTGGRTNFTDYVATFQTILGILLGDTEKTSGTNAGNTVSYVTTITGQYDASGSDVVITDGYGNTCTVASSEFSGKPWLKYYLVRFTNVGSSTYNLGVDMYYNEWGWVEVSATSGGTYTQANRTLSPSYSILKLDVGANISTVTTTHLTSVTKYFRDGWVA